jgi:hypothetical protein
MISPATIAAFSDSMWPWRLRKSTMIGIVPTISITAKSTMPTVAISLKFNSITIFFEAAKLPGLKRKDSQKYVKLF